MNHFMLPENVQLKPEGRLYTWDTRYGIYAMDMLVNSALKKGARKKNLKAKIFGGSSFRGKGSFQIGEINVRFAEKYLNLEEIQIISKDIGGMEARKIFFYPTTGKVYLRRIRGPETIREIEESSLKRIQEKMRILDQKPHFVDLENIF